jgi:outer membrane protein assembly factor BamB
MEMSKPSRALSMRWLFLSLGLLAAGCGSPTAAVISAPQPEETTFAKVVPPALAGSPGSDWPGFLGPFGNGTSPEKGILAPWPKDGLRQVWQTPIGSGYGAPVVSQGRLFLFDRVENKARLRCLKSTTGEPLWTFDYPTAYEDYYGYEEGPRCCPVADGDRVYTFGAEGMLHCVRATDGKEVWKVDTAKRFHVRQNFFGVASAPVIEGDLLIVPIGGSPADSDQTPLPELKGNGSGVVAFDKRTGEVKWQASDELASCASPTLATIDGRRWCFVFARGGLVGLNPATGKVDFHFPWRARAVESVNASNPVVAGDRVFITECYGPGSALLKVKPGSCAAVPLEHADLRRRLRLWLQRPQFQRRRAALRRAGHRQRHVAQPRLEPGIAAHGRRSFHLPGRVRRAAAAESESAKLRRSVTDEPGA